MSFVSKSGVVELRRLSETGTLVGDATDLFAIQALYLSGIIFSKQILVLGIRILMLLGLPDPYPDPLITSTDPAPDPAPDPSIIKQK